jgi:hypothetical protein
MSDTQPAPSKKPTRPRPPKPPAGYWLNRVKTAPMSLRRREQHISNYEAGLRYKKK